MDVVLAFGLESCDAASCRILAIDETIVWKVMIYLSTFPFLLICIFEGIIRLVKK